MQTKEELAPIAMAWQLGLQVEYRLHKTEWGTSSGGLLASRKNYSFPLDGHLPFLEHYAKKYIFRIKPDANS